jgi:hypothetical protein
MPRIRPLSATRVKVQMELSSLRNFLSRRHAASQYGIGAVQVMRRLRAALTALFDAHGRRRVGAVRHYLKHLDIAIARSPLDAQDQAMARETDRHGLGLTRRANGFYS